MCPGGLDGGDSCRFALDVFAHAADFSLQFFDLGAEVVGLAGRGRVAVEELQSRRESQAAAAEGDLPSSRRRAQKHDLEHVGLP